MFKNALFHLRRRLLVGGSVTALATACLGGAGAFAADSDKAVDKIHTATPIKHVLIIVGENHSFDHIYATYVPKHRNERVLNLLSEHIINADGSPGENFAKAHQYQVTSAPNGGKYFVSVDLKNKSLYNVLPPPEIGGVQNPPGAGVLFERIPSISGPIPPFG
jgi:phospholipase C